VCGVRVVAKVRGCDQVPRAYREWAFVADFVLLGEPEEGADLRVLFCWSLLALSRLGRSLGELILAYFFEQNLGHFSV
jgi:hypothetical protein